MEALWIIFCGHSNCSYNVPKGCNSVSLPYICPFSCINHALIISIDILLLLLFLLNFILGSFSRRTSTSACFQGNISPLRKICALFNGGVGCVYLGLGVWIMEEKFRTDRRVLPLHWWLVVLFQGFTWLFLGLTVSLNGQKLSKFFVRLSSILVCLFAGFLCFPSLLFAVVGREASVKIVLDVLSFPGAILILFSAFQGHKYAEAGRTVNDDMPYAPLPEANGSNKVDSDNFVTPFAVSGFFSTMSFWWLNPLMKKGKEKTLEDQDIPQLRLVDRAETRYSLFMDQLNKQTKNVFWAIVFCHWNDILVSGFFALTKVLTLSTGPLILNAFIEVAEGNEAFRYEGFVLAGGLFFAKFLESLSERQWYFRCRVIGLQVRSMLCAAIYRKQLRLSNAARRTHSSGEIMNYVTVDAYRVGEFPFFFHQMWATSLQLCIALAILCHAVGLATFAALVVIILTVLLNMPLAKLQYKYQTKLMVAQDERLKATTEALANMKVLKLYAWENHFKNVIEEIRKEEYVWLESVMLQKGYYLVLFWSTPILVSAATFWACYVLGVPLYASNVFTFLATLRLVQEPVRLIPDVVGALIQAKVALARIMVFLEAPELQSRHVRRKCSEMELKNSIVVKSVNLSWDNNCLMPVLRNINLEVKPGERIAICGEVGAGKSTLLSAILGEVPEVDGVIQVFGRIAYVSQIAWIQTGTIRENILFGSDKDKKRYQEAVEKCSLVKDLEMLPFGDLTEIGERGVNLSGGQKQRIQLARALYQNADVYLLDDPFSAVDAHTATSLFNEYVMGALSGKTVLLVTHQVDFLAAFDSVLLMSEGEILQAATYDQLMSSSQEFQALVNAHNNVASSEMVANFASHQRPKITAREIKQIYTEKQLKSSLGDQLIKKEEREIGDTGLKPYRQYLNQSKGFLYFSLATLSHLIFLVGQILQTSWVAANVQDPNDSRLRLVIVFSVIGCGLAFFLLARSFAVVVLGLESSKSIFSKLLSSFFRAPMSFYDSTPLGRILSRVSSDLSIVDLDLPLSLSFGVGAAMTTYAILGVLAVLTWKVLFITIPMVYLTILLQKYYFASAKELMRIDGTTKSFVASHLAESIAGGMTIRAFEEEDRFFAKNLKLIDKNASPFFHSFSANEWLIQRLEMLCAIVLSCSALVMALVPLGVSGSGFIGMALSYGLSLNVFLVIAIQNQCMLANHIIAVERLNQYMYIPSEAPEIIECSQPVPGWPAVGKVEICDLKVRYQPNTPLILHGISCTFEGGHRIGIVGRTGSGKTTLIIALFRLVEPTGGKIFIDGLDISTIGLHDLRSRLGIIPQEPTLFSGTVRYNLDPLSQQTDQELWEVLQKCKLMEAVQEKGGLNSLVEQDGSNWSMGQRQLFCLGRALLKRSRILVLDEATSSMDNATDAILQKTIKTEFTDCTVITVAHRIPSVMDCTMVLALSDGRLVEYDKPMKLMKMQGSLFGQLVKEYWSHAAKNDNVNSGSS